jgi:hypothetical protein
VIQGAAALACGCPAFAGVAATSPLKLQRCSHRDVHLLDGPMLDQHRHQQALFLGLGLIGMVVAAAIHYRLYRIWAPFLYLGSVLLLILVQSPLGTTVSGVNDLVTGRLAGVSAGAFDIDNGVTSIQSPAITLPATGTLTLSFQYYLAHGSNASSADYFRVRVVGTTTTTPLNVLGAPVNRNGIWTPFSGDISGHAGQTVRILIDAADASTASLVEAGVDDVKITQQ